MGKVWFNDGKLVFDEDGKLVLCDECPCDPYVESGCYMNGRGNLAVFGSSIERTVRVLSRGETIAPASWQEVGHELSPGAHDGWKFSSQTFGGAALLQDIPSFKHEYFNATQTNGGVFTQTVTYTGSRWELLTEIFPQNFNGSPAAYSWMKAIDATALYPGVSPRFFYYDSEGGSGNWWILDSTSTYRAMTSGDKLFSFVATCVSRCDQNVSYASGFNDEACMAVPSIIYVTVESDDSELDGEVLPARYFGAVGTSGSGWVCKTPNTTRNRGMAVLIKCVRSGGSAPAPFDTWKIDFGSVTSAALAGKASGGTQVDVPVGQWSHYCNNAPAYDSDNVPMSITSGDRANDIGIDSMSCATGAFSLVTDPFTLSGSGANVTLHMSE